jgi:hypothetical protein
MRWLSLVLLVACVDSKPQPIPLDRPFTCGGLTCGSGEICTSQESGSQCDVNEDAGIGPYQDFDFHCEKLPDACDGYPSCECVFGRTQFCSGDGTRWLTVECI